MVRLALWSANERTPSNEERDFLAGIRRILIAVKDPGAAALPAVNKGIQLARSFGASLELFHALDRRVYVDMLELNRIPVQAIEDQEREQFLQRLGRIAARARRHRVEATVAAEWDYPAYEAVVRRAADTDAELIVAQCHAGRHPAAALLEFADWELLRLAPVPVLLVKGARPYHHPTVLAAVDPGHAFAKPAKLDDEILRLGAAVAGALHGRLHAVHAFEPAPVNLATTIGLAAATARAQRAQRARAELEFDHLLDASGIAAARRHFVGGRPRQVLPQTAAQLRSDIVVMGAVSRSGLERIFIGNTAESLLDRLSCDLLIVKPVPFASRVARATRGARLVVRQPAL
jgi:universal stress protein E